MRDTNKKNGYRSLLNELKRKKINTWFDLTLFLDQIKDNRKKITPYHNLEDFYKGIAKGVAFITFDYGIDGVTIEVVKYAKTLEKILSPYRSKQRKNENLIHLFGGFFSKETEILFSEDWKTHHHANFQAFDSWWGYYDLFFKDLSRGSESYNKLAKGIWEQVIDICIEFGHTIVHEDIRLLIPVNVNSNPGNPPLAYALCLLSEYLKIPVLCSHHDFFWEDGHPPNSNKTGARDHFFKNYFVGEIFSVIEQVYPWDSPLWFHTVINTKQKEELVHKNGFNPIAIEVIPTSMELKKQRGINENDRRDIINRLQIIFQCGEDKGCVQCTDDRACTHSLDSFCEDPLEFAKKSRPILIAYQIKKTISLVKNNIILLQPTRIIRRKRIEIDFEFIHKLLQNEEFKTYFLKFIDLTITLLITGPYQISQSEYFIDLTKRYKDFIETLPTEFRDRIFLGLIFGLENNPDLKERGLKDLTIYDIYNISSIVLLPSETEGRGLPIIESCALGIPIISHRYTPEHVFKEVIGEDLEKSKRLQILSFKGKTIPDDIIKSSAQLIMYPECNQKVADENHLAVHHRFGPKNLEMAFVKSLITLFWRSRPNKHLINKVKSKIKEYKERTSYQEGFQLITVCENRRYMPGISIIEYMTMLKSLIDPSYFRTEERKLKSRLMRFALKFLTIRNEGKPLTRDEYIRFFKLIEYLLGYYDGKDPLIMDHSLSYRHRNQRHYPYRKMTEQELCGVIASLGRDIIKVNRLPEIPPVNFARFDKIEQAICDLLNIPKFRIAIDDTDYLLKILKSKRSIAYFPGDRLAQEMEVFALYSYKIRMGLDPLARLDDDSLAHFDQTEVGTFNIFVREQPLTSIHYHSVVNWINKNAFSEIKKLYKIGFIRIIKTKVLSLGQHLGQLGKVALKELLAIKKQNGVVISFGRNPFMLDLIDIDSIRLGRARNNYKANFMGIGKNDAFIQWVPAGFSPSLGFPTPIQRPTDFSLFFKSKEYLESVKKYGEETILKNLKTQCSRYNMPVAEALSCFLKDQDHKVEGNAIISHTISGTYPDQSPWLGNIVKISKELKKTFKIRYLKQDAKTVASMVSDFEGKSGKKVKVAWNGGYILNPELVGKLGIDENFIGSPLGLLINESQIKSPPLFNKVALLIDKQGHAHIDHVNLQAGLTIIFPDDSVLLLSSKQRNKILKNEASFFDLFSKKEYSIKGFIAYRFVGNKIIEKIEEQENLCILPIGITLCVPRGSQWDNYSAGDEVTFSIPSLEEYVESVEAGPLLVKNGRQAINMEKEGWTTDFSIATQAARLDYINMRGPKLGVGITSSGEIIIVAINGRIRESVGATHDELANILIDEGCMEAMGFDPGGSVTLLVDGKQLNISPYNPNYEDNIYSLDPTPRKVGSAVFVLKDEKD